MALPRFTRPAPNPSASCPNLEKCAMFPLFSLEASLRVWQNHYCQKDFASCERYKKMGAGRTVPDNLLPDGQMIGA